MVKQANKRSRPDAEAVPDRCCEGSSINSNSWPEAPETECCTTLLVSYVDHRQSEPKPAAATSPSAKDL